MKKLYFLLILTFSFSVLGQNLVLNPTFDDGLNNWTAGPSGSYTLPSVINGDGSDGANSANYVATATTGFYQEIAITGGHDLTISFWYKATGDNTDARIWSNYKDATNTIVYQDANTGNDPLRNNNGYLPTATSWTQVTINVTAPANATIFVLAVRAYNGGTVSFDQFSVVDQTSLNTTSFNAIDGLKMYPNPLTGNILNFSSNANASMTVQVYDVLGKEVVKGNVINNTFNTGNLKAGIYIVKITEEGKTATRKLVVK